MQAIKNTRFTIAITNRVIDTPLLKKLAKDKYTSMARVIHPFHTMYDGDVLYLVTTNEVNKYGTK
jgi:L-aminopeptidase/D-esterase-like protein